MRNYSDRPSIKICERKCNSARSRQSDSLRFYDYETNSMTERKKDFYNKNFATTYIKSHNTYKGNKSSSLSVQELNKINPLLKQKRKFENIIKQIPSLKKESLNIAKLYEKIDKNENNFGNSKGKYSSVCFNSNANFQKFSESKQKFINDMLHRNPIKNVISIKNKMENAQYRSKIKHYKNSSVSDIIFYNDQNFCDPRKNGFDKITNTNVNPSIKNFPNENKKSRLVHVYDNKQIYFI
jgi:hypothetical protein